MPNEYTIKRVSPPPLVSYQFVSLNGPLDGIGEQLEDLSRPGFDGAALRKTGKRGEPFSLVGVRDFLTRDDAKAFIDALKALQGAIVSVIDGHGIEWTGLALLRV